MIKSLQISLDGTIQFAEVQYFFQLDIPGQRKTVAMVSVYSPPDNHLLQLSLQTLRACKYTGDLSLVVVDTTTILSVISMPPLPLTTTENKSPQLREKYQDFYYVAEKPFLETVENSEETLRDAEDFDEGFDDV